WVIISISRGSSFENLISTIDLGDPLAPKLDAPVVPLIAEWNAEYDVIGSDGPVLYVLTNLDAPRKRIVAIDTRSPAAGNWKTLVPEGPDPIDSVDIIGGRFVVNTMHDASSRLAIFGKDG